MENLLQRDSQFWRNYSAWFLDLLEATKIRKLEETVTKIEIEHAFQPMVIEYISTHTKK